MAQEIDGVDLSSHDVGDVVDLPAPKARLLIAASDLTVRENHIDRDVLSVSRVLEPFDIAVLVDTSQDAEPFIPDFRQGLVEFLGAIGNRHEIALIGFGQRPSI